MLDELLYTSNPASLLVLKYDAPIPTASIRLAFPDQPVVLTTNVVDVDPAGIRTVAGTLATEVFVLESATLTPPVPAAEVKLTVPVTVCPAATMLVENPTFAKLGVFGFELGAGLMVSATDLVTLELDAVTVAGVEPVTVWVLIGKVCDVAPEGTTTLVGRLAAALELANTTVTPPVPAGAVNVTVPVSD